MATFEWRPLHPPHPRRPAISCRRACRVLARLSWYHGAAARIRARRTSSTPRQRQLDDAVMLVSNLHDRGSISRASCCVTAPDVALRHPPIAQGQVRLAILPANIFLMLTVDEARTFRPCAIGSSTPHVPKSSSARCRWRPPQQVATGMGITILSHMVYGRGPRMGHRIDLKTLDDNVHTREHRMPGRAKPIVAGVRAFLRVVALAYPGPEPVSVQIEAAVHDNRLTSVWVFFFANAKPTT